MRRSIHALAAGAAVIGIALLSSWVRAGDAAAARLAERPSPLVPPVPPHADSLPAPLVRDQDVPFTWSADLVLTPPSLVSPAEDAVLTAPQVSPAVPLPPAAWTGFAALAGLGAISVAKRLRRAR